MIVVDANVIAYLVISSEMTAKAKALAKADAAWITSPLWRFELTSALTTLLAARAMDLDAARDALLRADELMTPNERGVEQMAVIETARRLGISAYDAQYIALAERKSVKCVTADQKLLRKSSHVAISLDAAIARD
jgi:predicted nucleic acid-binding protein